MHRLVEACALLPLLHLDPARKNAVYCVGPLAEAMAEVALRFRDIEAVYLTVPPDIRDNRLRLGVPDAGACQALLLSPEVPADPHLGAIGRDGVIGLCTSAAGRAQAWFAAVRESFPRRYCPWREWLPAPLYGAVASPGGKPERRRPVPGGAKRLSTQYLPCLFTFGADEMPLVFGQP